MLILASCASGSHPATGIASWYGDELAGRPTATGEPFDPAGLTAAHRTLPLGSLALVTALDTGRAVVVRINDRGPFRGNRLIDLSRGAARLLGLNALGRVRVESAPPGTRPGLLAGGTAYRAARAVARGHYWLQVATFADEDHARALAVRLGATVTSAGQLWRVRLGPFDAQQASAARDDLAMRGYGDARFLPIP